MKKTSVIITYIATALYFTWFNIRTVMEEGVLTQRGGITIIFVLFALAYGLWKKPKIFWWLSLSFSSVSSLLLGYQFIVWLEFINNEAWKTPEVDASMFSIGVVSLFFLSLVSLILLLLPQNIVRASNKTLKKRRQ